MWPIALIPLIEAGALLRLEYAKNTNLICTSTHKEREIKIYEVRQDAYISETEERDLLMIYIRLQENYNWFSQKFTQKSSILEMGISPLLKYPPKLAPVRVQNYSNRTSVDHSKYAVTHTNCETYWKYRSTGRPTKWDFFPRATSVDRSVDWFQFLCMSVNRTSSIELKALSTFVFALSLSIGASSWNNYFRNFKLFVSSYRH